MDSFRDYHEAYRDAQRQANVYNRPMGLEKANEYGRTVYRIKMLPKLPKDRYGWETRCQVVDPDTGVWT